MEHEGEPVVGDRSRRAWKAWLLYCGAVVVITTISGLLLWHPWQHTATAGALPASILGQIQTFTPYGPKVLPAGLTIDTPSVSFQNGLLIFRLTGISGKSITVTEQALPPNLIFSDISFAGTIVHGADGEAVLNNLAKSTAGQMISADKKTLISVNSSDANNDELADLLRSLHAAY